MRIRGVCTIAPVIAAVGLLGAGCLGSGHHTRRATRSAGGNAPAITIAPEGNGAVVLPDSRVSVRLAAGRLRQVTVVDGHGHRAAGAYDSRGLTWRSSWALRPDAAYTVTALGTAPDGRSLRTQRRFRTKRVQARAATGMSPLDHETVGVGMPIQVFVRNTATKSALPVSGRAAKAAVERSMQLTMSKPVVGAWHWIDDSELDFRPKRYWPAGERVAVTSHLTGVRVTQHSWGARDQTISFTVGPRHISVVNNHRHVMSVYRAGRLVRSVPVSLGKPGDDTYTGTMIAQEKDKTTRMDSATTGHPGEYNITTHWNVRLTYSGEYVHSAPWSVGQQGSANVSHGCVNASPANAEWFFHFTNRGDVIKVTGTSRRLKWGNGPTPWALSWADWLKGSAVGGTVRASEMPSPAAPSGSPS